MRGGAYLLDAHAHSGTRLGKTWAKLPYVGVRNGVFSGGAANLLVWITAGKPAKSTTVDQEYDTFEVATSGTVGVRRDACRASSTRIPLQPSGLRGGVARPLGDEDECYAPRQVVVRVRAVLQDDGTLRRGQEHLTTHVPVREAKLAVRTLGGKTLVYADVHENGKARLFAAKSCTSG